jgi:ATP-dependent DNA helicase PIF1
MPPGSELADLISTVYSNLGNHVGDADYLRQRSILCAVNDDVDEVNTHIMDFIGGESRDLLSVDSIIHDGPQNDEMNAMFTLEFLNGLTSSSLPPHKLTLKIGCPVILLRNLLPQAGLCNGTRLIITSLSRAVVGATILTGDNAGDRVFLPRIPIIPSDLEMPFKFRRLQFPIRPAFAMTINKSQGQTLNTAGVYLKAPVFSHGQLYVALSRATNRSNLHVLIKQGEDQHPHGHTTNVVYPEILAH